jgi:hypothetical protein
VAQPTFPQTIAGPEWVPPSKGAEETGLSEEDQRKAILHRQRERIERQIAARTERRDELGGERGAGTEERGRTGRGVSPGGNTGGRGDAGARDRERLDNEIKALEEQLKPILDELRTLGESVSTDRTPTGRAEAEAPLPEILDAKDLPVWVHDVTAEPGKVYRYRMRAVLNNPLFARGQFLAEAQEAAAASPVLEGEWSDWSAPVAMEADQHFFVVSATQDDALGGPPRAAVEVYEFYYGYWRKGSTTLEPGDTVHARAKLPDTLVIYDPAKLEEMANQPRTGGGRDIPETGGGRRGFIEEDQRDERLTRIREDTGGEGAGAAAGEELPPGATKAEPWLDLAVPAMLLDVARIPGGDDRFQAVLRAPDGGISIRDAEGDRSDALYRRLAASAREGETQGQPRPDPNANRPKPVEREERRRYEPTDSGGGGGGGGGG